MTRDEAKKEWAKVHPLDLNLDSVIDVIYDDFEARTCENCINDYQCDIQDRLELEDYSLKFGCTFFREKESK